MKPGGDGSFQEYRVVVMRNSGFSGASPHSILVTFVRLLIPFSLNASIRKSQRL
jgi:hypothetical protein